MEFKGIEALVDRLTERVEILIAERDGLRLEVERLTALAAERDNECVRVRQEMASALEAAAEETMRADRNSAEIEAKLQTLNDRLIGLAADSGRSVEA